MALQEQFREATIYIYTGDVDEGEGKGGPSSILSRAAQRFNIRVHEENVRFVYMKRRKWVEAETFPSFTLLGQSMGSVLLAYEALALVPPPQIMLGMWCDAPFSLIFLVSPFSAKLIIATSLFFFFFFLFTFELSLSATYSVMFVHTHTHTHTHNVFCVTTFSISLFCSFTFVWLLFVFCLVVSGVFDVSVQVKLLDICFITR